MSPLALIALMVLPWSFPLAFTLRVRLPRSLSESNSPTFSFVVLIVRVMLLPVFLMSDFIYPRLVLSSVFATILLPRPTALPWSFISFTFSTCSGRAMRRAESTLCTLSRVCCPIENSPSLTFHSFFGANGVSSPLADRRMSLSAERSDRGMTCSLPLCISYAILIFNDTSQLFSFGSRKAKSGRDIASLWRFPLDESECRSILPSPFII